MNYQTTEDLNKDIKALVPKLPADLDLIVGVPRSGLLAANLLALYLNLPLTDIDGLCERRPLQTGQRFKKAIDFAACKKVLVVDDSINSGAQIQKVKSTIARANLPYKIYYAAVYATSESYKLIDYFSKIIDQPRYFEWNIMHHGPLLENSCVDLDGVLCRDPTDYENDDGENYRNFLRNVAPAFRPSVEIGWIVTCRLEKYRDLTEDWLKKHVIRYRNLVMMDLPDKKTRLASGNHALFKAEVYKSTNAMLFIESSFNQAQEIARISGKEVLCTETNQMISGQTTQNQTPQADSIPRNTDEVTEEKKEEKEAKDEILRGATDIARFNLLAHLIEGQKVLEIGCGNGDLSIEVTRKGFEIVGVDISKAGIKQAKGKAKRENLDSRAKFLVMDVTSLEFPANYFDTVLIPEVLEHMRDSRKLLEEAVRVVRNGGRIIVSVPDGLSVPFPGYRRVFFKDTLTTELSQYAEEITWHELPFKKWLVCSFFVRKKELDITDGPIVDIMMPTYNGRKYIRKAIKSVLDQTYQNWNLIIVNDGGEDVMDILDEFHDSRIKYIVAEHKGKAHALNVGIRNSSGELIGYLDDDDILYPIHLEVLVKAALEEKKDFVYSDWYEVSLDENNTEVGREFEFRQDVAPWMLIPQNYINHKCILHARSLLKKAGMYDEELDVIIDWDMIRRLSFICPPNHVWAVTSERICYYSRGIIDNRITGLWIRDPDKAGKSLERIINKTRDLKAKAEVLKEAIVKVIVSYYHPKVARFNELSNTLQARDSQIAELSNTLQARDSQIAELGNVIQAKDAQTAELNSAIDKMESNLLEKENQVTNLQRELDAVRFSLTWRAAKRLNFIIDKLIPSGTKRRLFAKLVFLSVTRPKSLLRNLNKTNVRRFFYYLRTTDAVVLDQMIASKLQISAPPVSRKLLAGIPNPDEIVTLGEVGKLIFKPLENPVVSIIIPVYNQWQYTYTCLKSILDNTADVAYEVIVANDCSTDQTPAMLKKVKGITVINTEKNLGFIRNCNKAASFAKGQYLLFLNNDTYVTKGWLKALVEPAENDEKVAIVGAKLLYPDGSLQEAGCIVWNDEKDLALNYGRYQNSNNYEFNFIREVDYCSGCCILVRRGVFEQLGGFNEIYAPAYSEDTELAFVARSMGYKVSYQPQSVIVHYEGATHGWDWNSDDRLENKAKFHKKWEPVLEKENFPCGEDVFLARDRSRNKKHILVIDDKVPTWDKDAGSLTVYSYLKLFSKLGFHVTFIPDNLLKLMPYTTELQQAGIEVVYGDFNFDIWIESNGKYLDIAWLARPDVSIKYINKIRKCSGAIILYYVHDLHYLREKRRYELEKKEAILAESNRLKKVEFSIFSKADVVLTPSGVEETILSGEFPNKKVEVIPAYFYDTRLPDTKIPPFEARKDIIYLGGFNHTPNIDAVLWFVSEVFHHIVSKLHNIRFIIVGNDPPQNIRELANKQIIVTGHVKDLKPYFDRARISVSPLRYGAGLKGKMVVSMSYGVPMVTTTIGNEGLGLIDGEQALIADDPQDFAKKVIELYTNKALWEKLSKRYVDIVNTRFSEEMAQQKILGITGLKLCPLCGALHNCPPPQGIENLREATLCHNCSQQSETQNGPPGGIGFKPGH